MSTYIVLLSKLVSVHYPKREGSDTNIPIAGNAEIPDPETHQLAREVVRRLALHGCGNLTGHVVEDSFSLIPLFRGGFGDVYSGNLRSGLRVAVKTPISR
ncbi:hypothetical protein OPQ81_011870 [Rhizoctonia solani]|nr:hypothetical protein OPQ81_011870 [Rhizoctonia solani]